MPATSNNLPALIQRRPSMWTCADGLLELLSAAPLATEAERSQLANKLETSDDVAWSELETWVGDWPQPPNALDELRSWLTETESLGLAHKTLAELGSGSGKSISLLGALVAALARFEEAVAARDDHCLFAGDAHRRSKALGVAVAPWSWFAGGTAKAWLERGPEATKQLCQLWLEGRVEPQDAALLRQAVGRDEGLRNALREVVAEATQELFVMRWTPDWSLDVARSEAELDSAAELLVCRLPHLEAQLSVCQHADGSYWRYADGSGELVPFATHEHAWTDPVLGELRTRIHVQVPNAAQDAWHGLTSFEQVAAGQPSARNEPIVTAIVASLHDGSLAGALQKGHQAFETGDDLSDVEEHLVAHAFEARIVLPDALKALSDAGVDIRALSERVTASDELHQSHGSAVQLVPDDLYQELTAGVPLDHNAWWGSRAALDQRVPPGVIEGALRALHLDESQASGADVLRFPRQGAITTSPQALASEVMAPLRLAAASADGVPAATEPPCSWIAPKPTTSPPDAATVVAAGRVPLLLFDEENQRGVIAELRIHVADHADEKAVWEHAPYLKKLARSVIRIAYYQAAALTPWGAAPHNFAAHRLQLEIDPAVAKSARLEVDGRSVGLPAALAFASTWLGRPLPTDVAAVGTVSPGGWVGAVGAVEAKTRRLAQLAERSDLRVLCAKDNANQVNDGGLQAVCVEKLKDALEVAKLELDSLDTSCFGPVSARKTKLGELVEDIRNGALGKHGVECTWGQLGDKTRRLIDSLKGEPGAGDLNEARCWLAIAYTHAGMLDDVDAALRDVELPGHAPPRLQTLFHIVRLGEAIDRRDLQSDETKERMANVERNLEALRTNPDPELHGRAAGTLGRAHLHAGALTKALPLLREGVAEHLANHPMEVGRSRIYLAMALRMTGDPQAALHEVVQGAHELATYTRTYSPEYEADTRMYLDYEMARILVSLERHDEAISCATRALRRCEWMFWPQLGIRRTLAWALRMTDRAKEADQQVERMRAMFIPPGHEELRKELFVEAQGYPIEGGEVY